LLLRQRQRRDGEGHPRAAGARQGAEVRAAVWQSAPPPPQQISFGTLGAAGRLPQRCACLALQRQQGAAPPWPGMRSGIAHVEPRPRGSPVTTCDAHAMDAPAPRAKL